MFYLAQIERAIWIEPNKFHCHKFEIPICNYSFDLAKQRIYQNLYFTTWVPLVDILQFTVVCTMHLAKNTQYWVITNTNRLYILHNEWYNPANHSNNTDKCQSTQAMKNVERFAIWVSFINTLNCSHLCCCSGHTQMCAKIYFIFSDKFLNGIVSL